MKPFSTFSAIPFLVHLLILVSANLDSDKQALLRFATSVPHQRTLNWNSTTPVCSWVGITCNNDFTNVVAVRLPGVGLMGHIPENTLGNLDSLQNLSLRSNLLSGTLPSNIISLPSLQYLYLQHNNFSGEIPNSLSSQLVVLDLSFNTFTGNVPETISNLTHLTGLNLANNYLSGSIPNLAVSNLKHLNLSHNNLNGSIPNSLQNFSSSSFVGNSLLCGLPLQVCSSPPLPHSPPHPQLPNERKLKKLRIGVIIAIAVGGASLLVLVAVVIFLCCYKKKRSGNSSSIKRNPSTTSGNKPKEVFGSGVQEPEKNKLVFFEGCSYNFDLEDLLRASAEVLGKGSFGTAYKAVLEESITVVVKRLKEVGVGKKEFEQQMDMVGRIGQHPNVLQLRAYYYSKDEKLLVYDYVPGGSLATLLHGNPSNLNGFSSFNCILVMLSLHNRIPQSNMWVT